MSRFAAILYTYLCKKFSYAIKNYEIEISLAPRRRLFQVISSLTLTADKNTPKFCFLLSSTCVLESVNYLGLPLHYRVKPTLSGLNLITVHLPRKAASGEKLDLAFYYTTEIPSTGSETIELHPKQHWYPYSPLPQKYTANLKIITPQQMRIIASGKFVRENPADTRVMVQWSAQTPFRGIHIIMGDFIKTAREGNPTLDTYYPRPLMNQGRAIADFGQSAITYLKETIGQAPADNGAIVLTDNLEYITQSSHFLTSISKGVINELKEMNSKERSIQLFQITARELAHRWLRHNLPTPQPQHSWYLVGLAEYLSWLMVEGEFGISARESLMLKARAEVLASTISIESQASGAEKSNYPSWLVAKASWIFRAIHSLSRDSFIPVIQEFYNNCPGQAPSPQDFFEALPLLSTEDRKQIYKEWVSSNRQLRAEISNARSFQDQEGKWQLVFSLINKGQLNWPHPVDIQVHLSDGTVQLHRLKIRQEPHLIITDVRVDRLHIDPDLKVLNWSDTNSYSCVTKY